VTQLLMVTSVTNVQTGTRTREKPEQLERAEDAFGL
jgi:hypothetical protein